MVGAHESQFYFIDCLFDLRVCECRPIKLLDEFVCHVLLEVWVLVKALSDRPRLVKQLLEPVLVLVEGHQTQTVCAVHLLRHIS